MEKRREQKGVIEFDPRKFPGSGARRKPLAKAKGSSEERRNGGLEDCCCFSDTPSARGLANTGWYTVVRVAYSWYQPVTKLQQKLHIWRDNLDT